MTTIRRGQERTLNAMESRRQQGFSMTEIMVAMVLGLFLGVSMIQLFVSSKRIYGTQDAAAQLQESGRVAVDILANSLRMAQFAGCTKCGSGCTLSRPSSGKAEWWEEMDTNGFMGYDGTACASNSNFPGPICGDKAGERVEGTDAMVILGGGENSYYANAYPPGSLNFTLNTIQRADGSALAKGDLLLACGNNVIALFSILNINGLSIEFADSKPDPNWTQDLPSFVIVVDYKPQAFYVGVGSGSKGKSLYRMRYNSEKKAMESEELIEGVEDMQLCYQQAGAYDSAARVSSWDQVHGVRMHILTASLGDGTVSTKQSYFFPKDDDCAKSRSTSDKNADLRLYRSFTTTVGIRNRL